MGLLGKSAQTHYNKGVTLARQGKYIDALKEYERAILKDDTFMYAFVNRADILSRLGRFEESLESLDRAIELKPDTLNAWIERGYVLMNLHRYQDSLDAYDRAISLRTYTDPIDHYNRGLALLELDRNEEALLAFETTLKHRPDHDGARVAQKKALYKLGQE